MWGEVTGQEFGDAKDTPSGAMRAIQIGVGVLVVVVLPVMLMDALVGKFGADAMIMGLLFGVLGSMIGGTRRMLYLAAAMGVSRRRRPLGGTTARGLHHSDPHRRSGVHATWHAATAKQGVTTSAPRLC